MKVKQILLDRINYSFFALILGFLGNTAESLEPIKLSSWDNSAIFELPKIKKEPEIEQIVEEYFTTLARQGINRERQSIWLQSDWVELADNKGDIPISSASLTKIATSLTALGKLGIDYEFVTRIHHTGKVTNGILEGDLVIGGSGDPFFVWEEGFALANTLNKLGINEVKGNLVIQGNFYMNYNNDPRKSGSLLKESLNPDLWSSSARKQFKSLPLTTPRGSVKISGKVVLDEKIPSDLKLVILHKSLSAIDILKQMNIYSNNKIAQIFADSLGGAKEVANYSAKTAKVPLSEIQLINGSGLGVGNRISPRSATKMLIAIDNLLKPHSLTVMDLFPVAGKDEVGTIEGRNLPPGTVVKTGTLNNVSALAGMIPTPFGDRIWFTITNSGSQIEYFRREQDRLLQNLVDYWQLKQPNLSEREDTKIYLGDPDRNIIHN